MERSMMFPIAEKAVRSMVWFMSAPYTYTVFPLRGARRSGKESDPGWEKVGRAGQKQA